MKRTWIFPVLLAATLPLAAQVQFDLDSLAAKATNTVNVTLDASMLKLAASFFSGNKSENASDIQKVIAGLKAITVKSYEFANEGAYKNTDLDPARRQLRAQGWSTMIQVHEKNENTEIYSKSANGQIAGLAVLSAEPKELTVVYIEGMIDLAKLADLAGHFGIPALPLPGAKSDSAKSKGTDQ